MRKVLILSFVLAPFCSSQQFPAFRWVKQADGSGSATFAGLGSDLQGNIYVVGSTTSSDLPVRAAAQDKIASPGRADVFVTKYDSSGNIVYSTYFGGAGDDIPTAMTVDPTGNVYVTGTTTSADFPTTAGVYSPSKPSLPVDGPTVESRASSFVFKLTSVGKVAYATYLLAAPGTTTRSIAVDKAGSAYVSGTTMGGLVTTPGAYRSICVCGIQSNGFFGVPYSDSFIIRMDAAASKAIFSTYLGISASLSSIDTLGSAIAIAPDGSAYVPGPYSVHRFDATGSKLLATKQLPGDLRSIALASDGSVYMAGTLNLGPIPFNPSARAFQTIPYVTPPLPYQCCGGGQGGVIKLDDQLTSIQAGTYFGGEYGSIPAAIALDPAGNVYIGGSTSPRSLPTLTPFFQGFGFVSPGQGLQSTGYLAKLNGVLSQLLFSSSFGDNESFSVKSVAISPNGSVALGGRTGGGFPAQGSVWINSLTLAPPQPLRVDAVENAASHLSDALTGGETILVPGLGFSTDSRLLIGGVAVTTLSITPTSIVAVAPSELSGDATTVQVLSGSDASNSVVVAIFTASPGLFSADGSGQGQGYIQNSDGSLNTPTNPATPGDRITIFATGVGGVTFDQGYAVTHSPVSVLVNGFYCAGIGAFMGPVEGLPGDVYKLSVYLPSLATLAANNPDLANFKFPALSGLILRIDGAPSQNGLAISIAQ